MKIDSNVKNNTMETRDIRSEKIHEQQNDMNCEMKKPKLYTPREAATELVEGVSYKLILDMCKKGQIVCIMSGVNYKITKEALYEALKIPAKYSFA